MSQLQVYKNLMGNARFLSLWSGSLLSGIGDSVLSVSLIWMIYRQTGSPFLLSLTLICLEVPKVIAAPLFGVLLDRYPATVFALLANCISGSLFIVLVVVPVTSTWGIVLFLGLIALSSSLAPVTNTCTNIIITETVEKEKWVLANSLMNIQFDLALSLGPVVGGILMTMGHLTAAYLFNAGTFFLAACLYFLAMPSHVRSEKREVVGAKSGKVRYKSWAYEIKEGFSWIYKSSSIRSIVMANFVWNFLVWGTSASLLPIYSDRHLAVGAWGYGSLTAALSVGIVLGSFFTGALNVKRVSLKALVFASMAVHGIAYGLLSVPVHLVSAILILLVCGIVSSPAMIYNRTYLQMVVPEEVRGRVFTFSGAVGALGYPIGTLLSASSLNILGAQESNWLFLLFGGISTVVILLLMGLVKNEQQATGTPDLSK